MELIVDTALRHRFQRCPVRVGAVSVCVLIVKSVFLKSIMIVLGDAEKKDGIFP
jgi:hypothetical protein